MVPLLGDVVLMMETHIVILGLVSVHEPIMVVCVQQA